MALDIKIKTNAKLIEKDLPEYKKDLEPYLKKVYYKLGFNY